MALVWLQKLDRTYIEGLEYPLLQDAHQYAFDHKTAITLAVASLFVLLKRPSLRSLFPLISGKQDVSSGQVRRGILNEIKEDIFEDNISGIRITIFRECGPLKNLWHHLKMYLRKVWVALFRSKSPNFPRPGKYIEIEDRCSSEDRRWASWSTAFYVHPSDPDKCQGLAATAFRDLASYDESNLPDVNDIDLGKINLDVHTPEARSVREYMERCKIDDLSVLRKINKKAIHVYVDVVYNSSGRPIGSLVVDSSRDGYFLDDDVEESLDKYIATLKHTYQEN